MSAVCERVLLAVGIACLACYALASVAAANTQHEARAAIERILAERSENGAREIAAVPHTGPEPTLGTDLVGLLEIPRLGLSAPIVEGDDSETLRGAAGHLPDTPKPWENGNSAIAAHRDGIFRPLRRIRVGDELRVQTPHGEVRYRVSATHIVVPTDLSVLEAKTPRMLTLITCYPFNYIGSAPKRFVVHAVAADDDGGR